jgi:hypothetical protein
MHVHAKFVVSSSQNNVEISTRILQKNLESELVPIRKLLSYYVPYFSEFLCGLIDLCSGPGDKERNGRDAGQNECSEPDARGKLPGYHFAPST